MTNGVEISQEDQIVRVTFARPDKKNAITQAMYGAMADAVEAFGEDARQRVLIFTGAGGMFTAGNDLEDFSTGAEGGTPPVERFLHSIRDCPKPLIAAVNGPAIGVGLTMLLHCDLVYAAKSAAFSAPFVKLGLVPEAASSMLLPASVGMAVANDILLAGRTLSAGEAHQYGLVARVFVDDELEEQISQIAHAIASSAPTALKRSKALIRHQSDRVAAHMMAEGRLFVEQLKSSDFTESVAAMKEKRPPVFR